MQLNHAVLGFALVLLTSRSVPAQGAYDAVDALFAPEPTRAVGEPLPAARSVEADNIHALSPTSVGLAGPDSMAYSGQPDLSAGDDQPSLEMAVADTAVSGAAQHKSKTGWDVDPVPEPSALAMGAVALMFFLFFFRRRRLG